MGHREKGECDEQKERETPAFDPTLKARQHDGTDDRGHQHATDERASHPDDLLKREWERHARGKRREPPDLLRALAQHRMAERLRHAKSMRPAGTQSPNAERDVSDVVDHQKRDDDRAGSSPESKDGKREE